MQGLSDWRAGARGHLVRSDARGESAAEVRPSARLGWDWTAWVPGVRWVATGRAETEREAQDLADAVLRAILPGCGRAAPVTSRGELDACAGDASCVRERLVLRWQSPLSYIRKRLAFLVCPPDEWSGTIELLKSIADELEDAAIDPAIRAEAPQASARAMRTWAAIAILEGADPADVAVRPRVGFFGEPARPRGGERAARAGDDYDLRAEGDHVDPTYWNTVRAYLRALPPSPEADGGGPELPDLSAATPCEYITEFGQCGLDSVWFSTSCDGSWYCAEHEPTWDPDRRRGGGE